MTQRNGGTPGKTVLESLEKTTEREFQANRTILAFDEYLTVLGESPTLQLRGSAQYAADMMDHFGREELPGPKMPALPRSTGSTFLTPLPTPAPEEWSDKKQFKPRSIKP